MSVELKNHIYLIGFMGVGKSSTARAIGRQTGAPLCDTDELIEEKMGMSISEIFEKYGEESFRKTETEVVRELIGKEPMVVSCGGGVIKSDENISLLKQGGVVVYLTADVEAILSRVRGRDTRPLLRGRMSIEGINELLIPRLPMYEKAMDIKVDTTGKNPDMVAAEIIDMVSNI